MPGAQPSSSPSEALQDFGPRRVFLRGPIWRLLPAFVDAEEWSIHRLPTTVVARTRITVDDHWRAKLAPPTASRAPTPNGPCQRAILLGLSALALLVAGCGGSTATERDPLKGDGKAWAKLNSADKATTAGFCLSENTKSGAERLASKLNEFYRSPNAEETKIVDACKQVTTKKGGIGQATSAPEPPSNTCEARGINARERNEGTCIDENGQKARVVNRDTTLKLKDLQARVTSVEVADSATGDVGSAAANGQFVIVRLAVTNDLDVPTRFNDSQDQVALTVNGKLFSEDFDTENGNLAGSFVWDAEEIQPTAEKEGAVVFDVPDRIARKVETGGNLVVLGFADKDRGADSGGPRLEGVIRLYR